MTTEPEPNETPEVEAAPPAVEQPVTPASRRRSGQRRGVTGSPIVRIGLAVIAAALIFGGGFAVGHWAFERTTTIAVPLSPPAPRASCRTCSQGRGGQSRNGPQMGQAPNLQQLLPLLEQMLNNRNGGGHASAPNSPANDDVQRQIQQLQQQVKQLQDQLKNSSR